MLQRLKQRPKFLAGCCLALLVMWGGIAFILHSMRSQTLEAAAASARNLSLSLAAHQASSIRAIDLSLSHLARDWQREPAAFAESVMRQEEHLKRERVIQVAVVGAEGELLFSRLPRPGSVNFADRDYFQLQKSRGTDELHISAPVLGRVTGHWAIQFSRPLIGRDGRFAGLVVMAVPPPALETALKDIDVGEDGIITLVRSDGSVLARSRDLARGVSVSVAGVPGLGPDDPAAGDFRSTGRIDGVDRILAYRRIEGYPLTLYVGRSVSAVLAPYERQRNLLLGAAALTTLLVAAVALLLASRWRDRERYLEAQQRLMLELHDGCIQAIYGIGLQLQNCRRLIGKDPARAERSLAEAGADLNLVIQDLRAIISGEPPRVYSEAEFMAEIDRIVPPRDGAGPTFTADIQPEALAGLAPGQAEHVLRIAREAVSNILRHAGASAARLELVLRGEAIRLEISDDGRGVAPAAPGALGLGMNNIRARARQLGGEATVLSSPGAGTSITVQFPVRP